MSKNKVIIDGIDVSECDYLYSGDWCDVEGCYCRQDKGCYFKQLARAKEETEKWKHQAELGSDTTDRLSKQLKQKEQECETLKSENFTFEELVKTQDDEIEKLKKNLQLSPKFSIENGVAHYTITQEEYEKLKAKEQECEELKRQINKQKNAKLQLSKLSNKQLQEFCNMKQALKEIEKYTRKQFCDNCESIGSTEYNSHCEYCEYQEYFDIINKNNELLSEVE